MLPLLLTVLCMLMPSTFAWSSGSGTCNANATSILAQTGRHPITPQLGFYLQLPTYYEMGLQTTISILNAGKLSQINGFSGFLIYAATADGKRQGRWSSVDGVSTTNMQNAVEAVNGVCYGQPHATITHSTGAVKPVGMSLTWTAPETDVGTVTFYGLVEFSGGMYYTQVLTPWNVCSPNALDVCTAFDPSTLPSGPLPPSPPGAASPFGIQPVDQTSCGDFIPLANAAIPAGYCASLYAGSFLRRPRGIFVTRFGDMLVLESGSGTIALLRDLNNDGTIDGTSSEYLVIFSQTGLNHALYVRNGFIYTSTQSTVYQIPFDESDPVSSIGKARVIVRNIPGGGHVTRTTLVSHDSQWLYVSIGSAGNVDNDDLRSRVNRYSLTIDFGANGYQWDDYLRPDGAVQPFAVGQRNAVGTAVSTDSTIWSVMNADDNLNRPDLGGYAIHNDNPAERLDRLLESKQNGFYGYPMCWAADILPGYNRGDVFYWAGDGKNWNSTYSDDWCRKNMLPADYYLTSHTAPLGLAFYDGKGKYAFPPEYYNTIFVGMHGSWNSDSPRGYKVVTVRTDDNANAIPETQRTFFGFVGPNERNDQWWRPVDVKVGVNGELFISSDNPVGIVVIRRLSSSHSVVLKPQLGTSGTNYTVIGGPTTPITDFSFDRPPANTSNPAFSWTTGSNEHRGLALFDGTKEYINLTAADNGAGTAIANETGGAMSIELWFNPHPYNKDDDAGAIQVIFESHAAQFTDSKQLDYFAVGLVNMDPDLQIANVVFISESGGSYTEATAVQFIASSTWTHLVVTFDKKGSMSMYFNGTGPVTGSHPSPPVYMYRQAGYLGRPHALTTGTWTELVYFAGAIDDFRMYSFPLSTSQVQSNHQLSVAGKVSPIVFGHFSVKPMESDEPTFTFRGINNRIGDQPVIPNDLFTGYAHFDGQSSYINLTNPANGIAVKLNNSLNQQVSQALSLEMWLRFDDLTTSSTILRIGSMLTISYNQYQFTFAFNSTAGPVSVSAPLYRLLPGSWTHVAWTVAIDSTYESIHTIYLNGTSAATSTLTAFLPFDVKNSYLGADWNGASLTRHFNGDIAAFRLWNYCLSSSQVRYLFAAEMSPSLVDMSGVDSYNGTSANLLITSVSTRPDLPSESSNSVVLPVVLSIVGTVVFGVILSALYVTRRRVISRSTYDHDNGILLSQN